MGLWAIVPVKPLQRGKSRLAGVMSEELRYQLNYRMLVETIKTLADVKEVEHTLVVSQDMEALSIASNFGAYTLREQGQLDLNHALEKATAEIRTYGSHAILVLPADLPLVKPGDIKDMISQAGHPPEIVIAPDRREEGTNAMYIDPAGAIIFMYGASSFHNHVKQAEQKGLHVEIFRQFRLALDLDLPEDLSVLENMQIKT